MRLKELRSGSLVKYKDRICTVENINGNNGMLYLHYNKDYYCGADIKDIEPIVIDEMSLEDSGFEHPYAGHSKLATEKYVYSVALESVENEIPKYRVIIRDINGQLKCDNSGISYWHQLQMITGLYED